MKKIWSITLLIFAVLSCTESKKKVTRFTDYSTYVNNIQLVSHTGVQTEIRFWSDRLKRNKNDEASLMKLAALHGELFKATGLLDHILTSDSLYNAALKADPNGSVDLFQGLASNAISQHKFQDAIKYAEKALVLNDKKATSLLLLVDASLEVGNYAKAREILLGFKNKSSFAYLVRKAKLQDHDGMLDSAIISMEKAYQRVKGNKALAEWTLSNLGDMYGHAGRIQDSYDSYLAVLKKNPASDYALQGIAWIALSHDYNIKDAKLIVDVLAKRNKAPALHLILSEIAELEDNKIEKRIQLNKFKALVGRPGYKRMFHKYLAILEAGEFDNPAEAVKIAKQEIKERPCPQSYDLLAWSYYHQKKYKAALEIASQNVEYQTYEPETLFHLGMIYQANGHDDKALDYLTEALESGFELGPSTTKKIRQALELL